MAHTSKGWLGSVRRFLRRAPRPSEATALPGAAPEPHAPAIDPRIGVLLGEWRDIRKSLRAEDTHAFAELSVFLASGGLLLAMDLACAAASTAALRAAAWVLPGIGIGLAAAFFALAWSARVRTRTLRQRGLQIEAAMQVLLPGVGHVPSLALLGRLTAACGKEPQSGLPARGTLYLTAALCWAGQWVWQGLVHWGG
jgi:hypothetical protein